MDKYITTNPSKYEVRQTNFNSQTQPTLVDITDKMNYCLHDQCAPFADFEDSFCEAQSSPEECLHNHILHFVRSREETQRRDFVDDATLMFPGYSRELIEATIDTVPIHINALYAVLKAITDTSSGCKVPAYVLPPLKKPPEHLVHQDELDAQSDEDIDDFIKKLVEIKPDLDILQGETAGLPEILNQSGTLDGEVNDHPNFAAPQVIDIEVMPQRNIVNFHEAAGPSRENKENQGCSTHQYVQQIPQCNIASINLENHNFDLPMKKQKKRKNGYSHNSLPVKKSSHNHHQEQPIIIQEDVNPALNRKLVTTLTEMFSDCEIQFIDNLCRGKEFSPQVVDHLTEHILFIDYPRKEQENETINFDEQLDIMISVLPDADPVFLASKLESIETADEFKELMSTFLETRNYPRLADAERKRDACAQLRQYTTDFNAEEFLKTIPDPKTYFSSDTFQAGVIKQKTLAYTHMSSFLRNFFDRMSIKRITQVLPKAKTLCEAVAMLRKDMAEQKYIIHSKRKHITLTGCYDIPLLQLFTYIEHETEIHTTQMELRHKAEQRKQQAIANKEVNTCVCCFDDEVMPEDSYLCPNGCLACIECIRRSVEILFAENQLQFPCLSACGAHFSLDTLQSCVSPKIFCKIAKRKQLEEVKAAGIEDLEICPFCDFAAIPAAADKVFKCFNPECMKETCRLCKEPSHIPLRCDEVEKDEDVKQRVFIENKMTEALMRVCHKCNLKYIKSDGCNKMTCLCGATLCYICGAKDVDYKHFNGQGASEPDKCALYSNTALLHEQAAIKGGMEAKKELGITNLKMDPLADADKRIDKAIQEYVKMPGVEL